ncbi:MAG: exonuclease subunit SbcD, partial [Thermoleophilia bacterium]
MRLIHTADWHLGRLFYNVHLTRDQEQVLEELIELVREVRPAAVLVAGDLYDRAVPPTEAVELLDHVSTEIVAGCGVPLIAIAGNHDSAVRLGFGSALLRAQGLHLVGELQPQPSPVALEDEHGPLYVHALPFADPAEARHAYGDDGLHDQQAVAAAGVARALAATPAGARRV